MTRAAPSATSALSVPAERLDSSPQHGVEEPGSWRLGALTVRVLNQ